MNLFFQVFKLQLLLVVPLIVTGQELTFFSYVGDDGRFPAFQMGQTLSQQFNTSFCIRADQTIANFIERDRNNLSIKMYNTQLYDSRKKNEMAEEVYSFELSNNKPIEKYGQFHINNNYRSNHFSSKHAYILGAPYLPKHSKNKVVWLNICPHLGYPSSIQSFKNVKHLTVQGDESRSGVYINPNIYDGSTFHLKYFGDPFFIKEALKLKKLESLVIRKPNVRSSFELDLFDLDGFPHSIVESEKLKSCHLEGFTFLPVCYGAIARLDYFGVNKIPLPELLNIVLAFSSAKKDTSYGNWKYLLDLVNIEKSNVMVENGVVKTYYKNDAPLSEGEMVHGQPTGIWRFWYPDGRLCEERTYINGKKQGNWAFYSISKATIDTTVFLTYQDDHLVFRRDRYLESTRYTKYSCEPGENSTMAFFETIYLLNWKDSSDVTISKSTIILSMNRIDTLLRQEERWMSSNDKWDYSKSHFCDKNNMETASSCSGKIGQLPMVSSKSGKIIEGDETKSAYTLMIDLENCLLEQTSFDSNNKENELRLKENNKKAITPEVWPCNVKP
ncbi:MAG: hypothetical protein V4604_05100 [Bacteroidota bacterium]